jgi:hypothetical protein
MGYLDDLKQKQKDPHKAILGFSTPDGFEKENKEALKKLVEQASQSKRSPKVISWKASYTRWAIAASFAIFLGIRAFNNTNSSTSESLTEDELMLLNAIFVDDNQVDDFLDTSLAEVLTQEMP